MKTPSILIVAILSLFLSPSCSKKSNSHTQTCQIITVTDQYGTSTTTYNITYDNNNRISTEQYTSSGTATSRVFTYLGNTVIVATTAGTVNARDSLTINSDGLIASDYYSDNNSNSSNTIYTYSGTEVLKSVLTQGANPPTTSTYTWTNGDMTAANQNGTNSTYTYNTKASQSGDYWQIVQLVNFGGFFVRTAHQLAGYQTGTTIENINYTYDNTGKITNVTGTQNTTVENITYQYLCN